MTKRLYDGGTILTMDEKMPCAEALLAEDGTIVAAGNMSDLKPLSEGAETIDLKGNTLMPAFVDGHSHMASEGIFSLKCNLIGCKSFAEILDRIRTYRDENGYTHGEPLMCRGYDQTELAEKSHPVASVLDSLGFDNPVVCVHQSGHMLTANTAALKACGLTDDVETPAGGFVGRDEDGHLTGYFEEKANALVNSHFNTVTEEQAATGIERVQKEYFGYGITTVQDGSCNKLKRIATYKKLEDEGKLKADVVIYMDAVSGPALWDQVFDLLGGREYGKHIKIGGVKIVLDGSPQAKTAWMKEPYEGETEYRGYPCYADEVVEKAVREASSYGLQVLAHCNGDAAAAQFVTAVEKAAASDPNVKKLRHEVVHTQTTADEELDRMARLGMIASVFAGHCWFWGDVHLANFGPVRGNRISPARGCIERAIPCNFHQDSPVTKPDMLHTVWCAVNRVTKGGKSVGPEFRLTAFEALWGATAGGAWSYFAEDTKGILKAGAFEDLIVLDRDPLKADPMELKDIRILRTIKNGGTVYTAPEEK